MLNVDLVSVGSNVRASLWRNPPRSCDSEHFSPQLPSWLPLGCSHSELVLFLSYIAWNARFLHSTNLIRRKVLKHPWTWSSDAQPAYTHLKSTNVRIETSSMPNIREILKHGIIICLTLLASTFYFREEPSAVQRSQRALDDVILLKPGRLMNITVPWWCLCWSF